MTTSAATPLAEPGKAVFSHDVICKMAAQLSAKTTHKPTVLIVAGSGLNALGDCLCDAQRIPYSEIEGFPTTTVPGHVGCFVFGRLAGKTVVVMQGRLHAYEGYSLSHVTLPVRVFGAMGVKRILLTNAAGGLSERLQAGHIMVLNDHINLPGMTGFNPLVGPNDDRQGPRFPAMTSAYCHVDRVLSLAGELGMADYVTQGVYVYLCGPAYETPAEARMLRGWGGDAVGMSTVPETVVAVHCGMEVVAMSLITNMVNMENHGPIANHEEVLEMANQRAGDLTKLVQAVVAHW